MNALPVDVAELAREAVASFPAAMKDDPTYWPAGGAPMVSEVASAVREMVRDNFRSLLSRRIGPHVQNVVTDMETAISEDGPLADLAAVWSAYVVGMDLEDFDTVEKAKDWDARVEALREQISGLVAGLPAPVVQGAAIDAYIADEPRLRDLAASQKFGCATPAETTGSEGAAPYLGMIKPAPAYSWDDEDEAPAPVAAPAASLPVGDVRPTPLLFQLLEPVGVLATDFAFITGINKATVSNAKSGKRAWQGLSEKQAHRLADEMDARAEAALALSRRLRALEPAVVDGNKA